MSRGFTLIEVLVAMVLLAFISIFTAKSINSAIHSKEKIQHDMDKYSTVRDALKVMERDINNAFNFQDFNARLFNLALQARASTAQSAKNNPNPNPQQPPPAGQPPNPNQAFQEHYPQKVEFKYTGFLGEKSQLDFTTLSNVRMTENEQVSSQAEIGYKLKSCRRRTQQSGSVQCLWRRVAPIIDDDLTKGGEDTVLLENVEKFELRYLGPGHEKEWIDTWLTNERGDVTTKGKFPYAVEITIEVLDKNKDSKDKPLRMTLVAAIRNPNNPPATQSQDPNNPNAIPDANAPQTQNQQLTPSQQGAGNAGQ